MDKKAKAAATEMAELLDTPFLRALSEPSRLQVLKVLLLRGPSDVATVAAELPQDRSVISRHLQFLERAGIARSSWEGRHRIYALDGATFIGRFEQLATRLRTLAPLCCGPFDPTPLVQLPKAGRPRSKRSPDHKAE